MRVCAAEIPASGSIKIECGKRAVRNFALRVYRSVAHADGLCPWERSFFFFPFFIRFCNRACERVCLRTQR